MDEALSLRNSLAEMGYELTPKRATEAVGYIDKIRRSVQEHPNQILRLAHLSEVERRSLIHQLAEAGKEVTFKELDDLIELLMAVYDQEHS